MRPTTSDRDEGLGVFGCDVIPARESVRVVPVGELDVATVKVLDQTLSELIEAGFTCLVLDLSRLTFMDSSGIHLILSYCETLKADDRQLTLIPGPSQVQRLFEITGLADRLPFSTNGGMAAAPALSSDRR